MGFLSPDYIGTLKWEDIKGTGSNYATRRISRAKVFGGWLVSSEGGSLTFIPDPNHEWKLDKN